MKYEVFTTEQAATDLRAIFEYIAYDLLAGQNALNQLDRLEQAILSLDEMPERYHLYDKEPWKERNLRIMPVDGYLVFYIPRSEEKTVTVIRVMYGRRDIDAQLKQTKLSENLTNSECANTATKRKMPVSECARQSPSRFAAMPRPVVAVNFAFWADCFRNPPVFAVTAPLPKKFSDTFWEPCLCAFPYLIRYGLRDVCLSRRPRAAARG